MTFEECQLLIPQYLAGELSGAEYEYFQNKLATSHELRSEVEALRVLWQDLELLPQGQPGPALRAKFYQKLNALERIGSAPATHSGNWRFKLWPQLAAGLLIFILGVSLGRFRPEERAGTTEIAKMNAQVQNLRELVALSLLDRQSASSRLEGVAWSSRIDRPNDEVVTALLTALNHDANVNVRLSSVNALERFTKNAVVGKALVDSLEHQDSPLVQIALIDSLVTIRNRAAAGELKKLTAASQLNPAVRERAQWGLQKLSFE